jgi:hypothetical protein
MKPTVCVDLDGVLADFSEGWKGVEHFGAPIPGAVEFTRQLSEIADVVIFTCRCQSALNHGVAPFLLANRVREWLDKHGVAYADVYIGQGKPVASAYVDDRAVVLRPEEKAGRPESLFRNALLDIRALL